MPPLDVAGRRLLERYQEREGDRALQDVPDSTGRDDAERIEVVMDAARRVRVVRVLDPRGLQTIDGLSSALHAAHGAADAARGVASLEQTGSVDAVIEEAAAYVARTRRIDPGTPPDVGREAALRRGPARRAQAPQAHGTSMNGYLRVVLDPHGGLLDVTADELWLSAAQPGQLARALTEAFAETWQGA